MMKPFPSQKDAAKQMIQPPSKIHQFKAGCFSGTAWHEEDTHCHS